MRLLIIRHGNPDYAHDTLTEKGWAEAHALVERMKTYGIDEIYASPMGRAQDTARPTAEALGITPVILPWLHEFPANIKHPCAPSRSAWEVPPSVWSEEPALGDRNGWRSTNLYGDTDCPRVFDEIGKALDEFLAGYGLRREGDIYRTAEGEKPADKTVAFFCHQGLGLALISYLLGLSPALAWYKMFLPTSSVTEIRFNKDWFDDTMYAAWAGSIGDISHLKERNF